MTRSGKSNLVKQMVRVIKRVADEGRVPIGQLIYDLNGEYANANRQDKGAWQESTLGQQGAGAIHYPAWRPGCRTTSTSS